MINILIQLQGTILVYIFFGFILKRTKLIDEHASSFLSKFLLEFILPVNIFYSSLNSFTFDSLKSCVFILIIAILIELVIYIMTNIKNKKMKKEQWMVLRYGLLVSNGGLIGTPVVEGLYGSSGVMYANIFLIPTRTMAYVAGENIFNPKARKKTLKETFFNLVINKVLLALFFGILFALCPFSFPSFISNALLGVSKCMSPLSLILVGSILAEKFEFNKEEDVDIFILTLLRQIVIPLLVCNVLRFISMDTMAKSIIILLAAMPIAATTAIYAHKYHNGDGFASKAVFVSTLSSTITLVIVMWIIECLII